MPHVRSATLADTENLASSLREEDRLEVQAASGLSPLSALVMGLLNSSKCMSIVDDDDKILGMFGVVTTSATPKMGAVWMLAADALFDYRRQFIKESWQWVDAVHSDYELIYNVVDERNTVHIRWIEWCGFTFLRRIEEYGLENRPFLEFVRMKDHV